MSDGAWRRYFQGVADLSDEAPEAVRDLERFLAGWEPAGEDFEPDLPGFAFHLGDLSDRELAWTEGTFQAHRRHFSDAGASATAELMEDLLDAILDECAARGIRSDTPV